MGYERYFTVFLDTYSIADFQPFNSFVEKLKGIDDELNTTYEKKKKYLSDKLSEPNIDDDPIFSELEKLYSEKDSFQSEMYKALVILLYSSIEIKLKKILQLYVKTHLDQVSESIDDIENYNIDKIKEKISRYFKTVNFSDITSYTEVYGVDVLRLLNNCLKHKGVASKNLEKKSAGKWKKKDSIMITEDQFYKLKKNSEDFICEIVKKCKEYTKNKRNKQQ